MRRFHHTKVRPAEFGSLFFIALPELTHTADGSPTLYVAALDEHYHSTRGAIQESEHVYIQAGLAAWLTTPRPACQLLEIGFGTGLNALLTWEYWQQAAPSMPLTYHSIEKFPLAPPLVAAYLAALPDAVGRATAFRAMHEAPWNASQELAAGFTLQKINGAFEETDLPSGAYDVIYYDAFAPRKQPELWTDAVLTRLASLLAPEGVVVTYCATGALKRAWRSAGLLVETLPGAPGKREMVRGRQRA